MSLLHRPTRAIFQTRCPSSLHRPSTPCRFHKLRRPVFKAAVGPIYRHRISKRTEGASVDCGAAEESLSAETVTAKSAEEGWKKTALLGALFAGWYGANILFNLYNKSVLKAYPVPITCTCIQFGVGGLIVVVAWLLRVIKMPKMNKSTVDCLFLVLYNTVSAVVGHPTLSIVAVSFTHTIKAMEPFFSVVLSSIFLGERPTALVLLTLIPIVGGVSLASLSEMSFNWTGFLSAMGSNVTFQSRNVLSKKTMGSTKLDLDNISLFSLITIASFFLLLPFAFMMEGDMYSQVTIASMGVISPRLLIGRAVIAAIFFHLYQQISYMILERVSPVTHSIGNCIKRVVVIIAAVLFFKNPMPFLNQLGTGFALFGVFLYSQAKRAGKKKAQ